MIDSPLLSQTSASFLNTSSFSSPSHLATVQATAMSPDTFCECSHHVEQAIEREYKGDDQEGLFGGDSDDTQHGLPPIASLLTEFQRRR